MRRDDALRLIKEHRSDLADRGVASIALFGSVARDEAGPNSDVDILVEFDRPVGYFGLAALQAHLEQLLGSAVDVFTPTMLKQRIHDGAMKDLIRVA